MQFIEIRGWLGNILESVQIQSLTKYIDFGVSLHKRNAERGMQHSHQFIADINTCYFNV